MISTSVPVRRLSSQPRTRASTCSSLVALVALLAACGTSGAPSDGPAPSGNNRPSETTSTSSEPATGAEPVDEPAEPSPSAETTIAKLGSTFTYDDGLAVTVSAPAPFTPSEFAVSDAPFPAFVSFDITVVNGTQTPYDPTLFTTSLQAANQEGSEVYDFSSGYEGSPSTTLLPGRESTFKIGYNVTDGSDLVMEVSPDFTRDSALFTS